MGFFTRKTKKEKLNDQYKKKLEQAYKMSTSNRTESDRLTAEANEILEEIKKLEMTENQSFFQSSPLALVYGIIPSSFFSTAYKYERI